MAKGDFDSPSRPATEEYRINWERIWGEYEIDSVYELPEVKAIVDRLADGVIAHHYKNGCPIIPEN